MARRNHYDVLGVSRSAAPDAIREAYRRKARDHHPDRAAHRGSAASSGPSMPEINEAYRVLSDPARRAVYDASLRGPGAARSASAASPASAGSARPTTPSPADVRAEMFPTGPARVPWRMLLFAGAVAIGGILVLAQFTEPSERQPDGILRVGDCVEFEPDNDAREVLCTGEGDYVVRAFITFDATCPGGTQPHRDRQGMGVVCVDRRD